MLRILFTVFAFLVTNIAYASLVIRNGETLQLSVNETLNIDGNLTIEVGGTLNGAAGSQIRISGDWSNSGVFAHGDGAVHFTGSSVSQITGANTFHTLISDLAQADTQSGKTLVFESNATQVITNHFQAKGDGESKLKITASSTS